MMKALPLAALATAPLFVTAAMITISAPAPAVGYEPVRLIAVHTQAGVAALRQYLPDDAPAAVGALTKFTSSVLTTGLNEAGSQVSGLSVADGLVRADMVTAYCRDGAAESQVVGLQTRAPAGPLSVDVRRHNPDGSTTITGLRLRLPASENRPATTLDVAVATCAAEQDRPRIILPGLPASLRETLMRAAREQGRDASAHTTVLVAAPASKDCGC
jgi:hypothetical protein